ncbi:MAG: ATPase, partial [Gammaproteobacteria bacterium]
LIENPYYQNSTKTQAGCQIDYLIQAKFNTLYVCEIKFSSQPVPVSIIAEVNEKINCLGLNKYFSVRPVLIHVNGVENQIIESEYFSKIIDFGALMNP